MAFTKIAAAGIGTTETVTVDGLTVINNGSFGGNLTVSGVLTYEDVTNVDSVGLITARNGIVVGSGITLSKDGDIFATGITTVSGNVKVGTGITLSPDGNIFATGISTLGGDIQMSGDNPEFEMNAGGPRFRVPASNTLSVFTSGGLGSTSDERLRIDSAGNMSLGKGSASSTSYGRNFQIHHDGTSGAAIHLTDNSTGSSNSDGFHIINTSSIAYLWQRENSHMVFATNNAERLRINSSGKVIIGNSGTTFGNAAVQSFIAHGNTAGESGFSSVDTTSVAAGVGGEIAFHGKYNTGAQDYAYYGHIRGVKENATNGNTACALTFHTRPDATAPQERLRIDSSGRLLINTTNNSNGHISSSNLAVQGADLAIFKDSGGDNAGVSGHKLKFVTQSGSLGEIDVLSEGGGGPSGRGGAMLFYTKENNTSSAAERVRITSTGLFGIGVTPSYRFHVKSGSVDQTARFDNSKTGDNLINYIGVSLGNAATTGTALFGITGHSTAGSQACWIGMGGDDVAGGYGLKVFRGGNAVNMQRFAIGTQDHSGFVSGTDASMIISYQKTYRFALYIRPSDNNTGGGSPALFANQAGTAIGSISANASNVAFNTSSDYRLKENDVSIIDGITRLKKLRPIKFNWKTDTEKTVDGFLAHEVSSSVPEAVMGEKDAVNEDGSIKPQQLDYSKLVPLLTAALQEEIAKRESLEARLDAAGL